MKLLKIKNLKIKEYNEESYGLFKINILKFEKQEYLINKIRQNIMGETKGTKLTETKIFVAKKETQNEAYYEINEIIDIEEIKETNTEIETNLKRIKIKQEKNQKENFIVIAELNKPTILKAEIFRCIGKIKNPNQIICRVISNKIKLKILFRIQNKKGLPFSPIKKANYIIEKKEKILFEVITDSTIKPFSTIKNSLKLLNATLRKIKN